MEKATFGAGCFWGVEAAFRRLAGVESTRAGYLGGKLDRPTYEDVCTDRTGHAEVVEVTFNPEVISFHDPLEVFWFPRPIVTEITPATTFWPAEEYHQQYLEKRGLANCHI